jgi:hypothetical protein
MSNAGGMAVFCTLDGAKPKVYGGGKPPIYFEYFISAAQHDNES